jgi:DNA-binding transcriptional MerR regulator
MSSRSYLSIGDVLTLLRQEFPDVTISKIRFLESQGLVNPERTPSGYRKFYEHDVERLRWVLRQQREHFLPLKVIKDRLDDEGEETPSHVGEAGTAATASEEPVLVGRRTSTQVAATAGTASTGEGRAADVPAAAQGSGSRLPGIESGAPVSNGSPATGGTGATTARGSTPDTAPRKTPNASRLNAPESPIGPGLSHDRGTAARPSHLGVGAQAPGPAVGSAHEPAGPTQGSSPRRSRANPPPTPVGRGGSPAGRSGTGASGPAVSPAAEPPVPSDLPDPPGSSGSSTGAPGAPGAPGDLPPDGPTASRAARPKGRRTVAPTTGTEPGSPVPAGASLSLEELSAASGLDVGVLEDLADFGLLAGTRVAGIVYFDEEALAVAKIAAGFAHFGVEPRHLRLYKNAADREAGFVEQIVLPLVRQRNPEARARANETVDELARLGQQLRSSLLRSALGNLLDG